MRENDGNLSYAHSEMRLEMRENGTFGWIKRVGRLRRATLRRIDILRINRCSYSFGSEVIGRFFTLRLMFISSYDFVIEKNYFWWHKIAASRPTEVRYLILDLNLPKQNLWAPATGLARITTTEMTFISLLIYANLKFFVATILTKLIEKIHCAV